MYNREKNMPAENRKFPYIVKLIEKDDNITTYRVSEELFMAIKKEVEPYRSYKSAAKKVKCVETGRIFENAGQANDFLISNGISESYNGFLRIKKACNKKIESAYGYHWEFV